MFVLNVLLLALFIHISNTVQSSIIKFEEIPLSSEKAIVKNLTNKDASSNTIGEQFVFRDIDDSTNKPKTVVSKADPSFVPDLANRVGIVGAGKCPINYKKVGFMCVPI